MPHHRLDRCARSNAVRALTLALAAVALTTAVTTVGSGAARAAPLAAPNIIMVMADDMSVSDLAFMPVVQERLVAGGVTFDDAISPYPLCCPARAMVATGQYDHNNGVLSNQWPTGGYYALRRPEDTLGTWLQQAGYRTAMIGKWLNQYGGAIPPDYAGPVTDRYQVPPGWDWWDAAVRDLYAYDHVSLAERHDGATLDQGVWPVADVVRHDEYVTDVLNQHAADFVSSSLASPQPFFLWLAQLAPHGRRLPSGAWTSPPPAPQDTDLPLTFLDDATPDSLRARYPGWNEADVSDKVTPVRDLRPTTVAQTRERVYARVRSLQAVDRGVGQLMDLVDAAGASENTVFVFLSDNGFSIGEHRHVGKNLPYEPEVRVPLVLAGSGVTPESLGVAALGDRTPALATLADVTATVVDLAGAQAFVQRPPDGISLVQPGLNPDNLPGPGRAALVERGSMTRPGDREYVGVRTPQMSYFMWQPDFALSPASTEAELYLWRRRPGEVDNLWAERDRYPVWSELERLALEKRTCSGVLPSDANPCLFVAPEGS